MVYDQAQSPRLGQRVPVESTFVQVFDVDPSTPTADLVEAAWPGMLIYRNDSSMLQVFDGEIDAWRDVAGGVPGHATYVGTSEPTGGTYTIGDTWYDSGAGYKAHVWDGTDWVPVTSEGGIKSFRQPEPPVSVNIGDIWIDSNDGEKMYRAAAVGITIIGAGGWVLVQDSHTAQVTADRKTRAYYALGYAPDDGNPETPPVFVPLVTAPDGSSLTAGDVWYQTDAQNRVWFWTGTAWVDATDPNTLSALSKAEATAGALEDLNISVENLALVGSSTNNTADTADGRISTSDYEPGTDDLTYIQYRKELDTSVTPPVEITTQYTASRQDGSIWFTQTRPRVNLCTNPSVEVDTTGWAALGATIIRELTPDESEDWTIRATATGTSAHMLTWGDPTGTPAATPCPAKPGETWSASIYAELVSGVGTDVVLQLLWVDSSDVVIDIVESVQLDLVVGAWTPELTTTTESRLWVSGVAPPLTTGVYVREVNPAGNDADVWHTGALLLEQRGDLGRYFDGNSYDGYWNGVPHGSTSQLHGDKIIQIWELRDSNWVRKFLADDSMAPINGSQIVGNIDGGLITDNTIVQDKQHVALVQALEDLDVGDLVNVYNDHGIFTARKADASLGKNYEAHGFVIDTTPIGAVARVYHVGYNQYLAGLTPGAAWLSPIPGKVGNRPARGPGELVQQVGFAPSATILNFQPRMAIKIS